MSVKHTIKGVPFGATVTVTGVYCADSTGTPSITLAHVSDAKVVYERPNKGDLMKRKADGKIGKITSVSEDGQHMYVDGMVEYWINWTQLTDKEVAEYYNAFTAELPLDVLLAALKDKIEQKHQQTALNIACGAGWNANQNPQ